ncbi:MAG: hypothetical protein ACI8O8_001906 [Oleiphilaceae bacterium]|jgi:hypothetical protein
MADACIIDQAISAAVLATPAMRTFAAYEWKAVLDHCVKRFTERFDKFAAAMMG